MKINYTNLTFTELVNKIGSSRFFEDAKKKLRKYVECKNCT